MQNVYVYNFFFKCLHFKHLVRRLNRNKSYSYKDYFHIYKESLQLCFCIALTNFIILPLKTLMIKENYIKCLNVQWKEYSLAPPPSFICHPTLFISALLSWFTPPRWTPNVQFWIWEFENHYLLPVEYNNGTGGGVSADQNKKCLCMKLKFIHAISLESII